MFFRPIVKSGHSSNIQIFLHIKIYSCSDTSENEKRNLGSLKSSRVHGGKNKRDVSYDDFPDDSEMIAYQNSPANYDELRYMLGELYPSYTDNDIRTGKRYLGKFSV